MMSYPVKIERVQNGYIVETGMLRERECYHTLDEVFARLLRYFEMLSETWSGTSHGQVIVLRGDRTQQWVKVAVED